VEARSRIERLPSRVIGRGAVAELLTANTFPIVLVSLIAAVLSLLSPFLLVADSWMTLVSGREIAQHGLPHHDHLTVWSLHERWIDQQWLAQLSWYGVDRVAGLAGVTLLGAFMVTLTYAGAMAAARALGAGARATFLIAFVAMFVAPWSWQVRAQSPALPLFVGALWLAADHVRRPSLRIVAALPLLLIWANVHGSVLLGGFMVSGAILLAAIRVRGERPLWPQLGLAAAAWVCVFATPYGLDIFRYYRLMLIDPPFGRMISEWDRTTPSGITALFFVLLAVTIVLAVWQRRRLVLFDCVVLVVTLAGALQAVRGIAWFTLAALVLVPRLLDGAIRRPDVVKLPRANLALSSLAIAAAAVVLIVVAAKPASWFEREWPTDALPAVRAAGADARVLGSDRHADWLLWRIPELRGRLAYDVRFELYTRAEIIALARFEFQHGAGWQRLADGYGVIVVDEDTDSSPTRALLRQPGVRAAYRDSDVSVLVRESQ
jgi:hypothetical protein